MPLRTGSITIGLPFCVIIILMCLSLARGLRREVTGQLTDAHKAHIAGGRASLNREVTLPE